jgi:Protein of unknown function (DUF993)
VSATVRLPRPDGSLEERRLAEPTRWERPSKPLTARVAFAAAHVVADPLGDNTPGAPAAVDWESTLAFRRHLWSYGLGVAEAMDTAQRGMGLDWATTRELIGRSAAAAREVGGRIAAGAGTDHAPADLGSLDDVTAAYAEQIEVVEASGAQVILMASRQLARLARGPEDYAKVYGALLDQVSRPVILHWLGPMFDPALHGYWGSPDVPAATAAFLDLVGRHAAKVDGVKVSLLDAEHEVALRTDLAALPHPVRLYTVDDFNYPELIDGDGTHHSDALLGIFAAIYPAASTALQAYDEGRAAEGRAILDSTRELGRHLFEAPTFYYKTGVAFLSWLNGRQPAFSMVGGLHAGRSVPHLVRAFELADRARLLLDPELAAHRMGLLLAVHGFDLT